MIRLSNGPATAALAAVLVLFGAAAQAQTADRERAQMLQMQQQLQKLQSDNGALQRERGQLQDQAKDAERLKRESAQTGKDLVRSRATAEAASKEASGLHAEIDALRTQTAAQIDQWKKALEERDAALRAATEQQHKNEAQIGLLAARLKAQTGRADLCEDKHAQALQFGREVVDVYEGSRLRLCEPVTGIWKVREEGKIQALRDRLYELRLDVPPQSAAVGDAPAAH